MCVSCSVRRTRSYAKPNTSRDDDSSIISKPAVARNTKRALSRGLALVRVPRERGAEWQNSGCRVEVAFYGWRTENSGARLGRREHSPPRNKAAPGSDSGATFNCFELTTILKRRFLGIPYVSLAGHSRHIQLGSQIRSTEQRAHDNVLGRDADYK